MRKFLWLRLAMVGAVALAGAAPIAEAKGAKKGKKLRSHWIRPQGEMGYEWYNVAGGGGPTVDISGFHFAAPVVVDFVVLPHMLHGYGLGGLGFGFGSGKEGLDVATVSFKFNPVYLQLGGGLSYEVIKKLNIEGALKLDFGFTGSAEAKSQFGTTGYDIILFSRTHFNLPAVRYEINRRMAVGGGFAFYSGKIQLKDLNEGVNANEQKISSGKSLTFFFGYTL